jgi:NADPH:quinone reductase-like Zn-dependent oxidoreductase
LDIVGSKGVDGVEPHRPQSVQLALLVAFVLTTLGGASLSEALSILGPGTPNVVGATATTGPLRNVDVLSVLTNSVAAAGVYGSWRSEQNNSSGKHQRKSCCVK